MVARKVKRVAVAVGGVIGVGLALVALALLSWTPQNSEDYESLHIVILLINVAGVIVLFALTVGNLTKLARDYRGNVPGSRLKARVVGMFVGLAVLPLLVVFYFSIQFINSGIDSWFSIEVEEGLDEALALGRGEFKSAFDLKTEPAALRTRYGDEFGIRVCNQRRQMCCRGPPPSTYHRYSSFLGHLTSPFS